MGSSDKTERYKEITHGYAGNKLAPTIRAHPILLLHGLLTWICLCGIGGTIIYFAHKVEVRNSKHELHSGVFAELEKSLTQEVNELSYGVKQLAFFAKMFPNCSVLDDNFVKSCDEIRRWNSHIERCDIYPSFVAKYSHPLTTATQSEAGTDWLAVNNPIAKWHLGHDVVYFSLPDFETEQGFYGMFARYSLWLNATSYDDDLGCGLHPSDCSDACWDETNKKKFYGMVHTQVNMGSLFSGKAEIIKNFERSGYLIDMKILNYPPNEYGGLVQQEVHHSSRRPGDEKEILEVSTGNLVWQVSVEPEDGWSPKWLVPVSIGVAVACAVIAVQHVIVLASRKRHHALLASMLPKKVIKHLAEAKGPSRFAEGFDEVTIFFSDIVGFTTLAAQLTPMQVVQLLDDLYHIYDAVASKYNVYKVETIGDAYMAVAGCPLREDPVVAARRMGAFALEVTEAVRNFHPPYMEGPIRIRVGIHSGPVVAGVVGAKMPRYCLFGDTVNTASRMESNSESYRIHISAATARLMSNSASRAFAPNIESSESCDSSTPIMSLDADVFGIELRGEIPIKGKGVMKTYWLTASTEGTGLFCSSPNSLESDNECAV